MSLDSADALLFDLGGVVIEIDFNRAFACWVAHAHHRLETIKAKLSFDGFYTRFSLNEVLMETRSGGTRNAPAT